MAKTKKHTLFHLISNFKIIQKTLFQFLAQNGDALISSPFLSISSLFKMLILYYIQVRSRLEAVFYYSMLHEPLLAAVCPCCTTVYLLHEPLLAVVKLSSN